MRAAVNVNCQGGGFLLVETDHTKLQWQCSTTARGITDILSDTPFYIYIVNMSAKSVS